MGIKIGDIDIANQTLDNEFRIHVLERLLEIILKNNPGLAKPTQTQLDQIRQEVLALLQQKYPNSGISLKQN